MKIMHDKEIWTVPVLFLFALFDGIEPEPVCRFEGSNQNLNPTTEGKLSKHYIFDARMKPASNPPFFMSWIVNPPVFNSGMV